MRKRFFLSLSLAFNQLFKTWDLYPWQVEGEHLGNCVDDFNRVNASLAKVKSYDVAIDVDSFDASKAKEGFR